MPFCFNCGSALRDGVKFCTNCGTNQSIFDTPEPASKPRDSSSPDPYDVGHVPPRGGGHSAVSGAAHAAGAAAKKGGSLLKWLIPLLATAGVATIVVVVLFATGVIGKSDEELIRDRIQALEDAYNAGDYDGVIECMDSEMQAVMNASMGLMDGLMSEASGFDIGMTDMFGLSGLMGYYEIEIHDIVINGDYATVTVTMHVNMYGDVQQSESTELPMVKDGWDWYIGGLSGMLDPYGMGSFY